MRPSEITQLRQTLGWKGFEMAHYLQVSPGTVSLWETGGRRPDPYRLAVLQQLKIRADQARTARQRRELTNLIKNAVVAGGVYLLIKTLFT